MTKMVPRDDGGQIPATYREFVEVFSKDMAETLLPHWSTDHAIDLEPSYNLSYGWIYNLLEFKLRTFKAYIEANLPNGFIEQSSSPILFAKKKDAGFRLSVKYTALNLAAVKNRYALLLIS